MFAISIIIFSLLATVKSAKILVVVPTPSISHQVVFRPIIQELINRHHEVTLITTDPIYPPGKSPNNLTEIDLHDLSYGLWHKMLNILPKNDHSDLLTEMTIVFYELSSIFGHQLKDKSVQKLITDKTVKFDLVIVEACIIPALIFAHIYEAPLIQMSSFGAIPGNMETVGASTHPFLYPTHYHQKLYNLTIWEKLDELYNHVAFNRMLKNQELDDDIMLQNIFGPGTPTLSNLKNKVQMLFLNMHPIWLHNQPVPSNVIYTWGIHKTPEKTLPKELLSYLDNSTNGVIYVSFGTNVKSSSIPQEIIKIFIKVFSQLAYNILWKWDMDELPGKPDNIKILKWVPQVEVLKHSNVKLFITQGGLQSTDEAITAGVPLIGIPMFADQQYNTEKYAYFKIGLKLNFKSITTENFETSIKSILANYESYRNNIIHLRTIMHDQPKPPLDNAIWWIEHAIRHGGARHLRTAAANMSWTKYYELDLVLVMLSALIIIFGLLFYSAYSCWKYIYGTILNLKKCKTKVS